MEETMKKVEMEKVFGSQKTAEIIEILEMLKGLSDKSRYRIRGYVDAVSFGERVAAV